MKGRMKVKKEEGDVEKKDIGDAVDQQKKEQIVIIEQYSIMIECLQFYCRGERLIE